MNDELLKQILGILGRIDARQNDQAEVLARLTASVEYHIKRTDLLEAQIKHTNEALVPIQAHVAFMNSIATIGSILVAAVLGAKSLGLF